MRGIQECYTKFTPDHLLLYSINTVWIPGYNCVYFVGLNGHLTVEHGACIITVFSDGPLEVQHYKVTNL